MSKLSELPRKKGERLIIITSTIYVNSNFTVLTDPSLRQQQYVDSIRWYLSVRTIDSIIVCDNSGFDYSLILELQDMADRNGKNIEFLNFRGDVERISTLGKGYGEGEIMRYLFSESRLLSYHESFYKVTGRVKVLNLERLVDNVKHDDICFQQIRINPFSNTDLIDTRLYYCSKPIFSTILLNEFEKVNDEKSYYLENAYTDALRLAGIKYRNFKILPRFEGFSGSHGGTLKLSAINYMIKYCYNIANGIYHDLFRK
ncbi:hypothetical protein ADIARSV_2856 [Arcticibacter svalbardensis MN12-7]|uniref:Glycosyltransferase n=1 Tax=Arcticibacter svalbardensis MN12-7 TaxID=1150600 RepID=R9GQA7_9SPHI|nr:hypothetical protein [Arcticibacter svalbardensis]EOR94022.1 hypothetical protein ADIARSV_2856 [Arcticibacter svalbardensis MN12-7]